MTPALLNDLGHYAAASGSRLLAAPNDTGLRAPGAQHR
jgi:hypothetical protein